MYTGNESTMKLVPENNKITFDEWEGSEVKCIDIKCNEKSVC